MRLSETEAFKSIAASGCLNLEPPVSLRPSEKTLHLGLRG